MAEGDAKEGVERGAENVRGGKGADGSRDRMERTLSRVMALLGTCLRPHAAPGSASDLARFRVVCLCCVCVRAMRLCVFVRASVRTFVRAFVRSDE